MDTIKSKLQETFFSIIPITVMVIILHFTLTPMEGNVMIRFVIGSVFMIIGLAIFLIGVDVGITPIGSIMGSGIAKSNKGWVVAISGIVLGFVISIAEPDLHILATQVSAVTGTMISKSMLLITVSVGIAVLLSLGLLRILYNIPLYRVLTALYGIIFILAIFTSQEFLAISFDASGATTGAMTVPFILALSLGISKMKKDSKASEKDSFGLVAIASTGAIIAVMITGLLMNVTDIAADARVAKQTADIGVWEPFIQSAMHIFAEVTLALSPILILFLIFQKLSFKISKHALIKIVFGILFSLIGLVLFLVGVNSGFMEVGSIVGYKLTQLNNPIFPVFIGFVLGMVTILAEPAVHVLTHQIEEVTSGYVDRKLVLFTLSVGVAIAVGLSMIRILVPEIKLWNYLLPGYAIAIILTYIVPKLFVGIAFDSGGVASGPMAATFILSFAQGVAQGTEGANVVIDGFGIISMIAMTPLIALQILGLVFKRKSAKEIPHAK